MFWGLEYATVIRDTLSSSIVTFSVASMMDLTVFLGMSSLLYSMWVNSLLGLLRMFSGGELVADGVKQWGTVCLGSTNDFSLGRRFRQVNLLGMI